MRADPQEKRARALAGVRPEHIRAVARRVIRPGAAVRDVVGALSPKLARRVEKIVREFRYGRAQRGFATRSRGGPGGASGSEPPPGDTNS